MIKQRQHLSVAFVLLVLLMALVCADSFGAKLSKLTMPGNLISGHAKYENDCKNCHQSFKKKAQKKLCISCHKKIKKDVAKKKGFHGKSKSVQTSQCVICHTEHIGRKGDIIKFDKGNFDHNMTDFKLKGRHRTLACQSCHKPKKKYREALGKCYSCHKDQDKHKNRLGKKCAECHNETSWQKSKYDHDKTKFKLTGKHKEIVCESCHANQRYKNTPLKCVSCHKINDVHKGELGADCKACHGTKSWKSVSFDHDAETKFAIKGQHKKLKCQSCHTKDPRDEKLAFTCVSCHKADDKHKGLYGKKCKTCHSEEEWAKNKFDHTQSTKFPLSGKHKKTACSDCHKKQVYQTKTSTVCYACHKQDDTHKGSQGKKCDQCHVDTGWQDKVAFDHGLTRFPLIGLHALVACGECHVNKQYRNTKRQCVACHQGNDTHKRQLGHVCEQCHTPNDWRIWKFNHNKQTKYKLKGKHKKVHCHSCHKKALKKKQTPKLETDCVNCHATDDEHDGNFGLDCERCHNVDSFKDISF